MLRLARFGVVALVALITIPTAAVRAATHMPIGFYDDASFRWSPDRSTNL
jgi:hypothetical protein